MADSRICSRCFRLIPTGEQECQHCAAVDAASRASRGQLLVLFGALAVVVGLWLVTDLLAKNFETRRDALGDAWFKQGESDFSAHKLDTAITDYRNALAYSRQNFAYRLRLAQALAASGRLRQARAYLLSLWSEQPANSIVNRELAHLSAQQGAFEDAVRYYHGAIYGVWPDNAEQQRRDTRFQLVEYLLQHHQTQAADAELIALSGELPRDPAPLTRAARLLMSAGDFSRAFGLFREAAEIDRRDAGAFAGAGQAAFRSADYLNAQHYLQRAVALSPDDAASDNLLKIARTILDLTPYQRGISSAERSRRVMNAIGLAQARVRHCLESQSSGLGSLLASGDLQSDGAQLDSIKASLSPSALAQDSDLVDSVMDLIGRIEQDSTKVCGEPQGADLALMLIAGKHQGATP